ncbi:SRPBCC family protein [Terriglobus albidus]|uniref:SRPBCC family protein n=1 Tax=Terriglobus albidus TaxID=1592106 RepID=UPI0021E059AB|nr:SRPBCC family protein [Terriglobus albidus]
MAAAPTSEKYQIEASITILRPVDDVFRFYRDFRNLPRFLGDVMAVELIGIRTSRWTIEGPFGIRTHWTVEVTEERPDELIRYETVTLPEIRTSWDVHFAPASDDAATTEVREVMKAPFGKIGQAALALIGKRPSSEVSANLRRLKELLETGRVMDTTYSVPGKFHHADHEVAAS